MKKYSNYIRYALLFLPMIESHLVARDHKVLETMAAYRNVISGLSYDSFDGDHHMISFHCDIDPICLYTPLSYEDSLETSLKKTYFFPHMQYDQKNIENFAQELSDSLESLGIFVELDTIHDKNHGLRISFTQQSSDGFDIIKEIDHDHQNVVFRLIAKI